MDAHRERAKDLCELAQHLQDRNPPFSRQCINQAKSLGKTGELAVPHCLMCETLFTNDNHTVRLKPRQKLTKQLKRLLERYTNLETTRTNGQSMTHNQIKMVKRYLNSHNTLVTTCKVCGKRTVTQCQSRSERALQVAAVMPESTATITQETDKETIPKAKEKKKKKKKKSVAVSGQVDARHQKMTKSKSPSSSTKAGLKGASKSVVQALLSPDTSGGVTKKKNRKGRNMHQHLETLLKAQSASQQTAKNKNKNSLVDFLDQLTY